MWEATRQREKEWKLAKERKRQEAVARRVRELTEGR